MGIPILALVIIFFCIALAGDSNQFGDHDTSPVHLSGLPNPSWPQSEGLSFDDLSRILLETPNAEKARQWSRYYTEGPHLAGKNRTQAEWTKDRWLSWGVHSAEIVAYDTYINYPLDHGLTLYENGKVKFEATLEEDVLDEDPATGSPDRVPTFHGYSANGNVTARYVFCNYGSYQDFEELEKADVDLQGKVALVKYGGIFRGLKVKRASELGMVGMIMYDDPGDDGEITEKNGHKAYPDGPARNPSSVQRGSVEALSKIVFVLVLATSLLTSFQV